MCYSGARPGDRRRRDETATDLPQEVAVEAETAMSSKEGARGKRDGKEKKGGGATNAKPFAFSSFADSALVPAAAAAAAMVLMTPGVMAASEELGVQTAMLGRRRRRPDGARMGERSSASPR